MNKPINIFVMFQPIKNLSDLNPSKVTSAQALRIFTTRKKFAVLAFGKLHLTNDPKRLVIENYNIHDAYEVEVYEL